MASEIADTLSRSRARAYLRCKGSAGMDHDSYDDTYTRGILNTVKTIAMVGVSANTSRPSYFAFKYLLERGYRMIPVNPGLAGQELLGRKAYARLADIPEPIDMVDIFRSSRHAIGIVEEALALSPRPQVIWMQLGICNNEAARLAEARGRRTVSTKSLARGFSGRCHASRLPEVLTHDSASINQRKDPRTVRSRHDKDRP